MQHRPVFKVHPVQLPVEPPLHTDTQTSTVTLAAHARRGLTSEGGYNCLSEIWLHADLQ